MNIVGQVINHKMFGEGIVTKNEDVSISVQFNNSIKIFLFPDCFKEFLTAKDKLVQDEIQLMIENKTKNQPTNEKTFKVENQIKAQLTQNKIDNYKKSVDYPKSNIAFKYNFCNGGKSESEIGFNGICSDNIIKNNIRILKREWCSSSDCACCQYINGKISRSELDAQMKNGGYVFYESSLFRDWRASAGYNIDQVPYKIKRTQVNSLAILTTRFLNENEEKYRKIIAVFLIDKVFEGDDYEEGYVESISKYKIKLSLKETQKLLFWKYHSNINKPETPLWGTGLFRYLDDIEAIQILQDIAEIKKDTSDEQLSSEFLNHFSKLKSIDMSMVPKTDGIPKGKL